MQTLERWYHQENVRFGASTSGKNKADVVLDRGNAYHRNIYKRLQKAAPTLLPSYTLLIEPWFRTFTWRQRSPDAVLVDREAGHAFVIEVKLNWTSGRDVKLLDEYLPIVRSAFELASCSPVLITADLRGYKHMPLLGIPHLPRARDWEPSFPTPLLLVPHGPA